MMLSTIGMADIVIFVRWDFKITAVLSMFIVFNLIALLMDVCFIDKYYICVDE